MDLATAKEKYKARAEKLLSRRFVIFFRLFRVARLRRLEELCG